jgi:hypothetical protein
MLSDKLSSAILVEPDELSRVSGGINEALKNLSVIYQTIPETLRPILDNTLVHLTLAKAQLNVILEDN